jgi:hypothetical protein
LNSPNPAQIPPGSKLPRFATITALHHWFPDANTPKRRTSHRTILLLLQLAITFVIFLLNLTFTLLSIRNKGTLSATYGEYFSGDCEKVKTYNLWLHLAINVVSAILLGSSDFCAQILAAPTRREVDEAHKRGEWFDIGINSWRNVRRIGRRRVVWWVLMGSSILLHLT